VGFSWGGERGSKGCTRTTGNMKWRKTGKPQWIANCRVMLGTYHSSGMLHHLYKCSVVYLNSSSTEAHFTSYYITVVVIVTRHFMLIKPLHEVNEINSLLIDSFFRNSPHTYGVERWSQHGKQFYLRHISMRWISHKTEGTQVSDCRITIDVELPNNKSVCEIN
jgi:hypothetical protein